MWQAKTTPDKITWLSRRIDDIRDELDDYYNTVGDEDDEYDKPSWAEQWDIRDLERELSESEDEYHELVLFDEYGYRDVYDLVTDAALMFEWMLDPQMHLTDYRDFERVVSIMLSVELATNDLIHRPSLDIVRSYPVYSTEDETRQALRRLRT